MLRSIYLSISLALLAAFALDASAGGQRSFVSGSGADVGTCTPTSPCRSFAYAIGNTATNGEVIVLDSAGYGPVTISISVSIIAPKGIYAGITTNNPATPGVLINSPGLFVTLRGLSINKTAVVGGGYGIRMTEQGTLNVEDCTISNFGIGGRGISFEHAGYLRIVDTAISRVDFGIEVGGTTWASISNSRIDDSYAGVQIRGGFGGDTTHVAITDSSVSKANYCINNFASTGTTGEISVTRLTAMNCGEAVANQPEGSGTITVSNSMLASNTTAFANHSGTFNSLGNNHSSGNTNPNVGTITTIGGI